MRWDRIVIKFPAPPGLGLRGGSKEAQHLKQQHGCGSNPRVIPQDAIQRPSWGTGVSLGPCSDNTCPSGPGTPLSHRREVRAAYTSLKTSALERFVEMQSRALADMLSTVSGPMAHHISARTVKHRGHTKLWTHATEAPLPKAQLPGLSPQDSGFQQPKGSL